MISPFRNIRWLGGAKRRRKKRLKLLYSSCARVCHMLMGIERQLSFPLV